MKRSLVVAAATIAMSLVGRVAPPTHAATIIYTETTLANGSLGGVPFTDKVVTVTLTADTSGVESFPDFPAALLNVGTATLTVGDMTATFNDPNGYAALVFPPIPDEGLLLPAFGIVEFDNPAHEGFTAILVVLDLSLAGYDLQSPFGPLTAAGEAGATQPDGSPVFYSTTAGALALTGGSDVVTFTAVIAPTAIPEPATLSLFGLGALGAMAARRRRTRQTSETTGGSPVLRR